MSEQQLSAFQEQIMRDGIRQMQLGLGCVALVITLVDAQGNMHCFSAGNRQVGDDLREIFAAGAATRGIERIKVD